ncbi:metal-dependent hydrolase family protein [Paraburkholderia susongensis]|uniref:Imidazolonepropionase n=1 Tax=Paraburkholderia susongensis TaxID=1515439 RepID=A0A1X7HZA5_9BURK|nr:amidohydrolase family protein [Paraburkholderia susongensis]SMG07394.1 Imidazolonepropionase [Paraburkholderia susongensis]
MLTLFKGARIVDANHNEDDQPYDVLVEDGVVREVATRIELRSAANVFDVKGKTLMPGLIDCHVHVLASMANLGTNAKLPNAFALFRAVPILRGMLERGFTSVRDAGGADYALAQAVETGLTPGPRLFTSGKALSQTGGHADFRVRLDHSPDNCPCSQYYGAIGRIVDGVDDIRRAIRQEIRQGATQIKIMASGGVSSPTDPIGNLQFSEDEIRAAVAEARQHQTYVMAHAYTAQAIKRAVELGVRTIEHGNLVDDEAAGVMAERGAFVVPTLITYEACRTDGAEAGFPPDSLVKNAAVLQKGLDSLEIYKRHAVKMAYGSDLLGTMHQRQSEELILRTRAFSNYEVICQATSVAAEVLNRTGELGVVAPGATADLLVVDGNPLESIELLGEQGRHLDVIMKQGEFFKNRLAT